MNAPSIDIKDILLRHPELRLVFGENLHVGREPSSPNNTVTIFDTSGSPPQLTYQRGENYEYPAIQIRVRNVSYADGFSLAKRIQGILHTISGIQINGSFYTLVYSTGDPFLLDWDANNRSRCIINFELQRR